MTSASFGWLAIAGFAALASAALLRRARTVPSDDEALLANIYR